jgi:UDP-N-acetylglucosamine--N-acetylmuramyl-(pentapeptide) pyrophosphoryl-undecaprenol N-acetylglucosamine transferase
MEARIVATRGMNFAAIRAGKFRRTQAAGAGVLAKVLDPRTLGPNARDALRAVAGVADAWQILRRFRPDVVFLKGGFVSVPVGLAARALRIPYVIHESDVSPGLANRILGKWAEKIAVGFPARSYREFERSRLVFTGNPVRSELAQATRAEGLAKLGLDEDVPVLFVTGGSAGAAQINNAVLAALPRLLEFCQVVHLTGEGELARVKFELRRHIKLDSHARYHPYGFLMAEMAPALAAADVVVARAGANTVAELAMLGKPTVLIPNSHMAGHQVENARMLSRSGAVRVLDGEKLTTERLVGEIKRLIENREELERLVQAMRQFYQPAAAEELAAVILAVGRVGERAPRTEGGAG